MRLSATTKKKGYHSLAFQVGDIVEGKITGIKPFGAFVALPDHKNGLVHISEVSYDFIQDLSTVLSEGQTVQVKVMNIAPDGKIALSIKRTGSPCLAAQACAAPRGHEL